MLAEYPPQKRADLAKRGVCLHSFQEERQQRGIRMPCGGFQPNQRLSHSIVVSSLSQSLQLRHLLLSDGLVHSQ